MGEIKRNQFLKGWVKSLHLIVLLIAIVNGQLNIPGHHHHQRNQHHNRHHWRQPVITSPSAAMAAPSQVWNNVDANTNDGSSSSSSSGYLPMPWSDGSKVKDIPNTSSWDDKSREQSSSWNFHENDGQRVREPSSSWQNSDRSRIKEPKFNWNDRPKVQQFDSPWESSNSDRSKVKIKQPNMNINWNGHPTVSTWSDNDNDNDKSTSTSTVHGHEQSQWSTRDMNQSPNWSEGSRLKPSTWAGSHRPNQFTWPDSDSSPQEEKNYGNSHGHEHRQPFTSYDNYNYNGPKGHQKKPTILRPYQRQDTNRSPTNSGLAKQSYFNSATLITRPKPKPFNSDFPSRPTSTWLHQGRSRVTSPTPVWSYSHTDSIKLDEQSHSSTSTNSRMTQRGKQFSWHDRAFSNQVEYWKRRKSGSNRHRPSSKFNRHSKKHRRNRINSHPSVLSPSTSNYNYRVNDLSGSKLSHVTTVPVPKDRNNFKKNNYNSPQLSSSDSLPRPNFNNYNRQRNNNKYRQPDYNFQENSYYNIKKEPDSKRINNNNYPSSNSRHSKPKFNWNEESSSNSNYEYNYNQPTFNDFSGDGESNSNANRNKLSSTRVNNNNNGHGNYPKLDPVYKWSDYKPHSNEKQSDKPKDLNADTKKTNYRYKVYDYSEDGLKLPSPPPPQSYSDVKSSTTNYDKYNFNNAREDNAFRQSGNGKWNQMTNLNQNNNKDYGTAAAAGKIAINLPTLDKVREQTKKEMEEETGKYSQQVGWGMEPKPTPLVKINLGRFVNNFNELCADYLPNMGFSYICSKKPRGGYAVDGTK